MASAYILFSESADRFYVGATNAVMSERLRKHNESAYGFHYTSTHHDWQLVLEIICHDFSEARRIELYIKRMKSRKFIQKLISNQRKQND